MRDRIAGADVLAAQVLAVVCGVAAAACGAPVLSAVAATAVIALALLVPVAGKSLFGWLRIVRRYRNSGEYPLGQTVDFRAPDGRPLGLYWDGSRVVAVVEVLAPVGGLTSISREDFDATHLLPLADLARNLHQHDIDLAGIDIVSHGYRSRPGTPASGVYEQLIGPLPATAVRTVWLAICFDAIACPRAVERRGGGSDGASRSITIATRRIVRSLDEIGCRSRVLTAPEIGRAVLQITGGADPRSIRQSWRFAQLGENVNIGSGIAPKALNAETLARLWVAPSRATTTVVRLRPGATPETVSVGAAWRLTTRTLPDVAVAKGAAAKGAAAKGAAAKGEVTMSGRHRDAVLAHLPIAVAGLEDLVPRTDLTYELLDELRLPTAGCGQLIGSDTHSNGIATRLVGTGVSTVYLAGELYLAQQVVFRALAVGARVLVRTDRPHDWEAMFRAVASPDTFLVVTEPQYSDAGFNATLIDGVVAPPPRAGVTAMYLTSDPSRWPTGRADVSLQQPGAAGSRVTLESGSKSIELSLVSIPSETAFISRPRTPRQSSLVG